MRFALLVLVSVVGCGGAPASQATCDVGSVAVRCADHAWTWGDAGASCATSACVEGSQCFVPGVWVTGTCHSTQ